MKVAITSAALVGYASAFAPSTISLRRTISLKESSTDAVAVPLEPTPAVKAEPVLPKMSQSLPFLARPAALTGEIPGDVGFDPLGFAQSSSELFNYREAEIKHARLAMLAAAGWPLSEVLDKKIAGRLVCYECILYPSDLLQNLIY